jgi:tripartite-type tricarboxylate transporter receptor subunit TctC
MQKKRSPMLPDVQSSTEAGYPDLDFNAYYGLFAPAGTPRPVLHKLADAISEALRTPELQKLLFDLACENVGAGPDEFAAFLKKDFERYQTAAEAAGITPD